MVIEVNNMETYPFSSFKHAKDNIPELITGATFKELCLFAGINTQVKEKKDLPAISPAVYPEGALRSKYSNPTLSFIMLDFDNSSKIITGLKPRVKEERVQERQATPEIISSYLSSLNIEHGYYTSFSNKKGWAKFRLLLPLDKEIPAALWPKTVEWLLKETRLNFWRASIDMPAVKDCARLYFLSSGNVKSDYVPGKKIRIDLEAIRKTPDRKEPEIPMTDEVKKQLEEARKSRTKIINTKGLDVLKIFHENNIETSEAIPYRENGFKYLLECPLIEEHASPTNWGDTALFCTEGHWSYHCFHTHQPTLQDILEYLES